MKLTRETFPPFFGFGCGLDRQNRLLIYFLFWSFGLHFRSRVQCHRCNNPAIYTCIENREGWGRDSPRDPLCATCGSFGPCPSDSEAHHELIPRDQLWEYRTH